MVWTGFSMVLFLSIAFLAANALGGSVFLLMLLVALVSLIRIIQGREPLSESFHGNS